MRSLAIVAIGFASLVAFGFTTTLPACDGPPDKTCFADHVNALGTDQDAGPNRECSHCLQTANAPNSCCDAVGECDEDPTHECAPSFKAAHLCVAAGGPSEESRCKGLLKNDRAMRLYQCMHDTCGKDCRVPSCELNQAVPLLVNPTCDSCVGGSCCEAINTCYASGNRRCKLIVECIATQCASAFGSTLTEFEVLSPEQRQAARSAVKGGGVLPRELGACSQRCFDDFAPRGDGATGDDLKARTDAFEVYACGAEARCGTKCAQPDAGPSAADGASSGL